MIEVRVLSGLLEISGRMEHMLRHFIHYYQINVFVAVLCSSFSLDRPVLLPVLKVDCVFFSSLAGTCRK